MNRFTVRRAFVATIPVMAGYLVLGIAYGILMENAGYSPLWALAMSVFIFAESMQFVAIDLLTGILTAYSLFRDGSVKREAAK